MDTGVGSGAITASDLGGFVVHGVFTRVPRDRESPYATDVVPLRVDVVWGVSSVTKTIRGVSYLDNHAIVCTSVARPARPTKVLSLIVWYVGAIPRKVEISVDKTNIN